MCRMAREGEVCRECLRKCLAIHRGKHDRSQKVLSFFKVMYGKNISELLFVPPKYSRKFASLKGKKCYIEDSTGHKWKVVLSDVDGSLAIKKGWPEFFKDQSIEQGDLLVFYYIEESHFFVTIYGRSGCEKPVSVEWSYQNKRLKTTINTTTKNYSSDSSYDEQESPQKSGYDNAFAVPQQNTDFILSQDDVNNVNKSSVVSDKVPKTDVLMEPCFLTEHKTTSAKEDDRDLLFDLSVFELPNLKPTVAMEADKDHLIESLDSNMANKDVDVREDHREQLTDMLSFELPDMKPTTAMEADKDHLIESFDSNMANNNVHVKKDHREQLADMPSFKLPDMKPTSAMEADKDHLTKSLDTNMANNIVDVKKDHREQLTDMPSFELPDMTSSFAKKGGENSLSNLSTSKPIDKKVDANIIGELQVQGNACSQVLGALHRVQPGDASVDNANKIELSQARTVLPSSKTEANQLKSECVTVASVSPIVAMPLKPVMPLKVDAFEPSAAPGHCHPPGETMRVVKQEPRGFEQDLLNKVVDSTPGLKLDPMAEDVKVIPIVKTEPVDCFDYDSAPTIKITCSIPPDSESFLVLPEPLQLKRGHSMRFRQKLIFLKNSAGEIWPVVYHNTNLKVLASGWNAFRRANKIRTGDKCDFVVDNLDKGIFRVETHSN